MFKQKNIKSFFKPVVDNTESNQEPPAKRCKPDKDLSVSKSSIQEYCSVDDMQKVLTLCNKLKILDPEMGKSWFLALEPEFHKPRFQRLNEFVKKERETYKVYPRPEDVWSWTKCCKLKDVKVVIIGQDPYHNPGQAHGLSFSVKAGVRPPPSLLNIYKELTTDIPGFQTPSHGDLTKWANQGVLLLNACLTVREHAPNSHANQGWEHITDAAINAVNSACHQVVFLLWGAYAQKKAARVDRKEHHVLNAPHPSPLSASRGFFGCKHFSKCNQLLEESGKSPIDWTL